MMSILKHSSFLPHFKRHNYNLNGKIRYILNKNVSKSFIRTCHGYSNIEKKLREQDEVTNDYELIYRNKGTWMCNAVFYSANVSISLIIISAIIWKQKNIDPHTEVNGARLAKSNTEVAILATLLLAIFYIARILSYKIAFRIYYNKTLNTYRIISLHNMPFLVSVNEFPAGSLMERKYTLCRIIGFGREFTANKKHYVFDDDSFRTPADRHKLLQEYEYSPAQDNK